jgi:exosortase A
MNADTQSPGKRWRSTLAAVVVAIVALVAIFWSTASGMVHIWYHFETYTHGFLIVPITLWLVWQKRRHLAAYEPQPSPLFLVMLAGALAAWVLARLTGVQVVEQAAFVAVLISTVATLVGYQVSRFLMFPLLFLFFAVPMGEDLVPPMMEFTATFTVAALELTGIPVYRDGLFFSLPTGDWSVVEACSGVRYLIASVTLGVMYAYITYHTLWKRLLFIALSAIVPIFANGVRAYLIVMIGHLSSMEYATGVDHLVYGWVFFGLVMFLLFWIGSYWQESEPPPVAVAPPRDMSVTAVSTLVSAMVVVAVSLSVSASWMAGRAMSIEPTIHGELALSEAGHGWQVLQEASPPWATLHHPNAMAINQRMLKRGADVRLQAVLYPHQQQGLEAISFDNRMAGEGARMVDLGQHLVRVGSEQFSAVQEKAVIRLNGVDEEFLVWRWYRVAGSSLSNRYHGKAIEALARIYPGRADGAWIAISTPLVAGETGQSQARLQAFAGEVLPSLYVAMDQLVGVD